MWEFLQTAQGIALVSVLVAGLSVFVTGVSIWLNYRGSEKRLAHEKQMQAEQLSHERREAVRVTAAGAYAKASDVLSDVNVNTIHNIAAESESGLPDEIKIRSLDAQRSLELVRALGWSEDVRQRALDLEVELLRYMNVGFATVGAIRSESLNQGTVLERFESQGEDAFDALDAYRRAISE